MSSVRPMKVRNEWFAAECPGGHRHAIMEVVLLDDALRYADERVAEALRLEREYGTGLEIELANDAWIAHHPHVKHPNLTPSAPPENGGGGGESLPLQRTHGARGAATSTSPAARLESSTDVRWDLTAAGKNALANALIADCTDELDGPGEFR